MDHSALAVGPVAPSLTDELRPLYDALADSPTDPTHLRALFDLYQRRRMHDQACCVAEALMALRKASPGQTLWRGQHRPRGAIAARRPLSLQVLRDHVVHPDQDRYITAILTTIAPALAGWRALDLPGTLDSADLVDASTHPSDAARMVKYAHRVLGVDMPTLFLRPEDHGDYTLINAKDGDYLRPTLVLFDELLDRRKEPELGYAIGRAMADLYRPHFAFVAIDRSPAALRCVLQACLRASGHPAEGDMAALDAIASELLRRLPTTAEQDLFRIVQLAVEAEVELDAERWAETSELTACRIGLLLSGDLHSASRALRSEPSPLCTPTRWSAKERLHELVRYGISEDYFLARQAIGIDTTLGSR